MICPNCGRETPEGETCRHCHMSTEFVKVMNCRPKYVPGLSDDEHIKSLSHAEKASKNLPQRGILIHVLISAITILVCLLLCFWFFRGRKTEEIKKDIKTEETESEKVVTIVPLAPEETESEEVITTVPLAPEETESPDQTITGEEENHG